MVGSVAVQLSASERTTLRRLADALVPSIGVSDDTNGFYRRKATDLLVDEDVVRIIERYVSSKDRADFRRLLHTVESPFLNLILCRSPRSFQSMDPQEREEYLLGWARSRLGVKRRGFHAIKRLVLFLTYAKTSRDGRNPNWSAIGYDGPSPGGGPVSPLDDLRIVPIRPDRETNLECDVCVIGSGAGGAAVAAKLSQAGWKVVVLEAGPYRASADFSQLEAETYDAMFERHGVLTTQDLAFGVLAGRTAGGSATINWMTSLRPPTWARAEWDRACGMAGVAGPEFDRILDDVWSRLGVTTEESIVNPSNDALRRGCEALGFRMGLDYDVIPRNARGCEGRCDFCFFGCVYDAKQSPLVTYLPDAYRAGARFLFDARADRVLIEGGEARGVEASHSSGGREVPVHIRARAVVVAGGAVQTPAILLRSGVRFRGVGLGLRLDPTTAVLAEYPHRVEMWKGPMQTIVVKRFQDSDEGHHGPWFESAPGHPGLAALALPWSGGRSHKDGMRRIAHAAASIVLVRDVSEGRVRIDVQGEPVLDYRLAPRDRANLVRGLQEVGRIHLAAGARRIATLHLQECSVGDGHAPISPGDFDAFLDRIAQLGIRENGVALFSAHPMGSARAGGDPRTSTARPTGECHEVRNLWIGDGSLLPTAPGVNPMITITALAIRTAGFVHERLSSGI